MAWRKWFVRGVVSIVAGLCAAGAYVYQQWTNPAAVREQVITKLHSLFPGAEVAVDSARLTLMGRIHVTAARIARKDDPDQTDAVQVPSAYLYHDKEKLLEGELSLRKVELFRPRFRIYRNKDGTWNVQGLLGPQRLDRPIPTLVVHQGTLILEDRTTSGNISSIEITNCNLTMINDPLPSLGFEGIAQASLVGKVAVSGSLQRATNELTLSIQTRDTPLSARLLQRIAPFCPKNSVEHFSLDGEADFDVSLTRHPGRVPEVHYDVASAIRKTRLAHANLPLPLDQLEAKLRVVDGAVTLEDAQAFAGAAVVRLRGTTALPCPDQNFEAFVAIDGLPISDDSKRGLSDDVRKIVHMFDPKGSVGLRMSLLKRDGEWARFDDGRESSIAILPQRIAATFSKFPYPLTEVAGEIECHLVSKKAVYQLSGRASGQPVKIRGSSVGKGDGLDLTTEILASGVPIDETILTALPPEPEKIARSFHARGRFDVVASIRHQPGKPAFENRFHLTFRDCDVHWDAFPLPLSRVSARVELTPDGWECGDFRGQHGAGQFHIKGRSRHDRTATERAGDSEKPGEPQQAVSKAGFTLEILGTNVVFSPALFAALEPMPALKKVWTTFAPSGVMNFSALIDRPSASLENLDVRVKANGFSVEPGFFPYKLSDVAGVVHYHDGRIDLADLTARHEGTRFVAAAGRVDLKPGGGYHADFPDIDMDGLVADADLLRALPESLASASRSLGFSDPVRAKSRVVVAQAGDPDSKPDIYWNAQAWIRDGRFRTLVPLEEVTGVVACRGRHDGAKILGMQGNVLVEKASIVKQPFRDVHAHFRIEAQAPDVLLAGVSAPQFGGDITGEVRIDFEKETRFELNLTASQIDLKKFGEHNLGEKSQLEGKAVGRLHLTGSSAGVKSLEGYGSFDVFAGKLYNLPLILDLLKFLGLRWPDRTAFEEVHALFRIQGPRVTLRKLELQGNAVSLSGQGDFNFDGTDLAVDFYPTWARIEQLLPPALRSAPAAVSKNFLIIEMRGKVTANADDLKFHKRPMPILVDPLMSVRERMIGVGPERRTEPVTQGSPPPRLPPLFPPRRNE